MEETLTEALRVAAEAGDVEAQYRLAVLNDEGEAIAEALRWYRRAAERGHPRTQWRLGYAYREGDGVEQNDREAVRWHCLAAQAGDPAAQYDLARMCEEGWGTPRDIPEGLRLFRAAAEQGDAEAQCNIAVKYLHGWGGLSQNVRAALRWFRCAAEQGDGDALYNLGVLYHTGEGVPPDSVEAERLYTLAAVQGHEAAMRELGLRSDEHGVLAPSHYSSAAEFRADTAAGAVPAWCGDRASPPPEARTPPVRGNALPACVAPAARPVPLRRRLERFRRLPGKRGFTSHQ